jgi:hypothetical protein
MNQQDEDEESIEYWKAKYGFFFKIIYRINDL